MLSDRIVSFGENVRPAERRLNTFFGRKSVKFVISGIAAVAFTFLSGYYWVTAGHEGVGMYILSGLMFFLMFAALGGFFANIGKGGFKRYVVADIAAAAIFTLTTPVLALFYGHDLEIVYAKFFSMYLYGVTENLLCFGITAALSISLGHFVLHRKKR